MVHLPYLQLFSDVNKRSSRLAANLPLIRANLCPLTFLDVPENAYSLSMLGIYEMNRVDLLRDLFMWAYERSTQEYLVIKQDLIAPDPLRLAWREMIKETVRSVVAQPERAPLDIIKEDLYIDHDYNLETLPERQIRNNLISSPTPARAEKSQRVGSSPSMPP